MGIGDKLRAKREKMGWTIKDVSRKTRIASKYLKALEEEDYSVFPSEVYLKGYLKLYAEVLKLKAEDLIKEYESSRKAEEVIVTPEEEPAPSILPYILGTAAAAIIIAAGLALKCVLKKSPSPKVSTVQTSVAKQPSAPAQKPVVFPPEEKPAPPPPSPQPVSQKPAGFVIKTASPRIFLEGKALEATWLRLIKDEKEEKDMELSQGDFFQEAAAKSIKLWVGNAAGISLKVNGVPYPGDMPLGKHGQVIRKEFYITKAEDGYLIKVRDW